MKKVLLSIIIPIYNTELHLEKCINSVINQSYKSLDIILVNDGSTDNSGKICDMFAAQDERIRVYHQENRGLIQARKKGVELAQGELVTFVDSDDWIEENMYESMIEVYVTEKVDLVSSGLKYDYNNEKDTVYQELDLLAEGVYDRENIQKDILPIMIWNNEYGRRSITSSVCNKLFKRELLQKTICRVDDRLTFGEDAAITYLYLVKANKISIMNSSWYHYVIRKNSMVRSVDIGAFEKIHILQSYFQKEYGELGILEDMMYQMKRYLCTFLREALSDIFDVEIEKVRYIFPYELVPKDSRIILYGAGVVGRSYWNGLRYGEYAEVVSWVDKNYERKLEGQVIIENPKEISQREFDYIIIAIENENVAREIKGSLLELGIQSEKIIWKKPKIIG